jgi:K+-sensing histidine kinase KdpD
VNRQNRLLENMVTQRTSELVEKNEEIVTQKESIVAQNNRLVEVQALIEERNNELRIVNEELEDRVIQRTQELQTANIHLKKANEELDTFVYRSYHDIIGPLSRIHGLCHVALLDVEDTKALEYIQKVGQSCEDAKHTLQRVLRIHDIRNHELLMTEVDILALIHKILASFEEELRQLQVEISCESDFGSPMIKSDNELLTIILHNLIENAVRYSRYAQESYIKILIGKMPDGFMKIGILDNGMGIPKEVRNKVFTMFFRGSVEKSGIGLGLYHTKVAVQRVGGQIIYQHTEINETLFELQIPGKEGSKTTVFRQDGAKAKS